MAYEKSDPKKRRTARVVRWAVLATVLIASTVLGLVHQYVPEARTAGVDALCPFGGIEALWSLLTTGGYIQKIAASSLVLLVASVLVAAVFGRAFCGQFCPLGAVQELFGRIGRGIFRRQLVMPAVLDRPARYLKYVVLAVFTVWTWRAGELVMRPYDPWVAYHHLTSAELLTEFGIGLAVLGVTVAGSIAYDRFFCKYACPMGATLGLVNKLSWFKVRRAADTCIDCKLCDKACPVGITVSTADSVKSAECLACGECVNACPVADTLEFSTPKRARSLSALWVTLGTLAVFAAVIGGATLTGDFEWAKPSLAEQIEEGTAESSGAREGSAAEAPAVGDVPAGAFDTTAIKGYMTLTEVAEASGIPLAELRAELGGISEADAGKPMKEVVEGYGVDVEDVRTYVGEHAR